MRSLALVLILIPMIARGDLAPGALAAGPFPDSPVQLLAIQNGHIAPAPASNVVENSLKKLEANFGVRLTQRVLAGYILDLDMVDDQSTLAGFDLDKHVADSWFAPWFHNPAPTTPGSVEYISNLWKYATGAVSDPNREKASQAFADSEIDHVFFPASKFGQGTYFNTVTASANDYGFESVLHEALHIWNFRNQDVVSKLLHSPGSYYDRAKLSESACHDYAGVSGRFSASDYCGFKTRREAMVAVLDAGHWPQRYGERTERLSTNPVDKYGCTAFGGQQVVIGGQSHCLHKNDDSLIGDLHSLDNEMEYFAILMQLYVFSPKDFSKIATPLEAKFASQLFAGDFK